MQYEKLNTKYTNINTNKFMHSEVGQVTNPENCKNCSCKCAQLLQYTTHTQHNTTQQYTHNATQNSLLMISPLSPDNHHSSEI